MAGKGSEGFINPACKSGRPPPCFASFATFCRTFFPSAHCAGDDCDAPHEKTVEVYSFVDPEAFARGISSGYLPSVAGVGHSWTCLLNELGLSRATDSILLDRAAQEGRLLVSRDKISAVWFSYSTWEEVLFICVSRPRLCKRLMPN